MLNKKSFFAVLFVLSFLFGCSGSVDISKFNAEEYYNYALKHYTDGDYEEAIQDFQNFLLQYSGSAYNDHAQYYLGMTYFQRRQYLLGAYEFSKLIRNLPASPYVPEAQFMLGESYFQLSPPYPLDQAYTKKAIEELQAFIDFFPANAKVGEAEKKIKTLTEKLAEKDYRSAVIYEKMEYTKAALKYYTAVAETYHDTKFAPQALYKKIKLEVSKGMTADVLTDINTFKNRYSADENVSELKEIEVKLTAAK